MSIDQLETGSFATQEHAAGGKTSIHMVCWNIARGSKLEGVVDFLSASNADLVLLQETDRDARRTGYRNIAREIAQKLGMNYAFGVEFEELGQGNGKLPAHHGQATLSVWPLSNTRVLRFRRQSKFWRPFWWTPEVAWTQRRLGGRIALVSQLAIGAEELAVYNLHLESRRSNELRCAQIREVLEDSRRYGCAAVVIGGDCNFDLRQGPAASVIEQMGFHNPFKDVVADTARFRRLGRSGAIDWILLGGPLSARDPQVHSSISASDHFPLSITLELQNNIAPAR